MAILPARTGSDDGLQYRAESNDHRLPRRATSEWCGKSLGHYVENTGSDVLQFLEVFRASKYEEVSLAEWLGHLPPELVMQHLNLTREDLEKLPPRTVAASSPSD